MTNVALVVAVARTSSQEVYGSFAVLLAMVVFVVGLARACWGTLIAVRGSCDDGFDALEARSIFTAGLLFAAIGSVICAAAYGSVVTIELPPSFLALALLGPLVVAQDLLRFAAVSFQRAGDALWSDGLWLVILALPLSLDLLSARVAFSASTYILLWLGGCAAALIFLVVRLRPRIRMRGLGIWLRSRRVDVVRLILDGSLGGSVALLVSISTAKFLSLADVAALRGANMLIGPLAVLFSAIQLVLVPELSRRTMRQQRKISLWLLLSLGSVVIAWGTLLSLLPPSIGVEILGQSWGGARKIIPITSAEYVLWATAAVPIALLKARQMFGQVLLARVVYVVAAAVGLFVVVSLDAGLVAVAASLVVAVAVHTCIAWQSQIRGPRAQRGNRPQDSGSEGAGRGTELSASP
ncbi:hypothetical protein GCM10027601_43330 [Nocardioides ungokensis]